MSVCEAAPREPACQTIEFAVAGRHVRVIGIRGANELGEVHKAIEAIASDGLGLDHLNTTGIAWEPVH